jgi:hypothetical protein
MKSPISPGNTIRGIALIAVLILLTVLAIIASAFVIYMSIEGNTAQIIMAKTQSDMLAQSGLAHAMSHLRKDADEQPAWDDPDESWNQKFKPVSQDPGEAIDVDGLPDSDSDARWVYVRNEDGDIAGRYAVMVEDESGKININAATALSPDMQNEGFGTFEIMLTDGDKAGLPISLEFGKNLLRYRYGRDYRPGQAYEDDNYTVSTYLADEIDNDADGLVDEEKEGIDEPGEYDTARLKWDDRSFMSINEAVNLCSPNGKLSPQHSRLLSRYATIHSCSSDTYWDERNEAWKKQVNLNIASKDQVSRLMRKANEESQFEARAGNLRGLVCNVIDYRDENHVLSTHSSEYGVEAVCFNEIMANDGSYAVESEWNDPLYADKKRHVHRFGWWYHLADIFYSPYNHNALFSWKIKSVGGRGGGGSCLQNGERTYSPGTTTVRLYDDMRRWPNYNDADRRFRKILKDNKGWLPNQFKNAQLIVSRSGQITSDPRKGIRYPILGNSRNTLTVGYNDSKENTYALLAGIAGQASLSNVIWIDTLWRHGQTVSSMFPNQTEYFCVPIQTDAEINPKESQYYYVYIGDQAFTGNMWDYGYPLQGKTIPWKGYNRYLDMDGDPSRDSRTEIETLTREDLVGSTLEMPSGEDSVDLLRFAYNDGEPVRAREDYIHVVLTTCDDAGYANGINRTPASIANKNKTVIRFLYMMRPDIVELINISDRPISLRNWRVVINTGSFADQLGIIKSGRHFSPKLRRAYDNPNPIIPPGGYFYLTNKRAIFDHDYGADKDGVWGNSAEEQAPCYEMLDTLWGVRYKISKVTTWLLYVEGANWRKDQMRNEFAEIHTTRQPPDRNSPMGLRKVISGNGRNYLETPYSWSNDGTQKGMIQVGDTVLVTGMPREGGFLSMTMKNQYNQITARTIEYGSVEPEELNWSTEKVDPTHYTWTKSENPTFGGMPEKAHNRSYLRAAFIKPHVKNNHYSSPGELQKVRKAEDWENIGMKRKGQASVRTLKGLVKYFTVSGIKLEAEEEGVHIGGWRSGKGTVKQGDATQCVATDVNWEPGIWRDQLLRIMTGEQKGESYVIADNTPNSVIVDGYSCPAQKQLRVRPGDTFCVGPGYSSALYYTRQNGEQGEWEWKNKGLQRSSYGLYIAGLNDSIKTTEFLEENHNAEIRVEAYNYETHAYEPVPIPHEKTDLKTRLRDVYRPESQTGRHQYEKSDSVFCGMIHPRHISPDGGIRLRLTAHNLHHTDSSGFAWFDYAYLAPGHAFGKININTAPPRVLQALQGVSKELAGNIAEGKDRRGRAGLRPYKNIGDVLDVKDMTPKIFTKICNLITTRSDQYRVCVVAESLHDTNGDGTFNRNLGDKVLARSEVNALVDRSRLMDEDTGTTGFDVRIIQ